MPKEQFEAAWTLAFTEARFPALVLDPAGKVVRSNQKGQDWLAQHSLDDELRGPGALALPMEGGQLRAQGRAGARSNILYLGLADGFTLVAWDPEECGLLEDYVRLFSRFLRSEEALRQRNDRLEVYHELLTHDAPNYITAVYGYLQMIQSQELPREKLQKYIDTSVRQTEALNHMIDTARTLRQLETTPLGVTDRIDIREAVEQAIRKVVDANPGKPSEVQDHVPSGTVIRGEPGLEEVFRIIINNAIRYSDSPRVFVDLTEEGDDWHLTFTDNGRGIPDDKKEFLFLRFDRLDKQRKIRGSGLSLALARALVERHNGRIWVENAVTGDYSKGSVFHVVLPKA